MEVIPTDGFQIISKLKPKMVRIVLLRADEERKISKQALPYSRIGSTLQASL
jgi:hypothetical protein